MNLLKCGYFYGVLKHNSYGGVVIKLKKHIGLENLNTKNCFNINPQIKKSEIIIAGVWLLKNVFIAPLIRLASSPCDSSKVTNRNI